MASKYRDLWNNAGGAAPKDWDFVSIEDLLLTPKSISVGVMYPGEDTPGGIPLVRVADVKDGSISQRPDFCISEEVSHEYRRTLLNGDELLITLVGNPGDCVVVTDEMKGWNVARALAVLRLKDPTIRSWLRYVLLSKPAKHLIDARLNTTVQKTLNLKDIRELAIPLPDKSVRDAIVKIASDLESKIVLNRQINQTLEQIALAIFKFWFVDFEPVKAKIQAKQNGQDPERAAMCAISGKTDEELDTLSEEQRQQLTTTIALFPDELEDSELGEIPKGWGERKIEQILKLAYGKALKKTDRNPGNVPVYGSGGITGAHNIHLVEGPGIVVGRKGTVGSLYWEEDKFFPIDTVFYVVPKEGFNLGYIYYLLQTLGLEDMNTDAAVPGLNRNNVYRLSVPGHSIELVELFTKVVNSFSNKVSNNKKESTSLIDIRDSLLPKLLSGNL